MFINVTSHTEESLCRLVLQGPFPPESVLHMCPKLGEAPGHCLHYWSRHPMWLQQSISSHGKKLNGSHCPSTCSSLEMLKCGGKDKAELSRKATS